MIRRAVLLLVLIVAVGGTQRDVSAQQWAIDPAPMLTLGDDPADTSVIFASIEGATRLPNGQILVGDVGAFALQLFDQNGRLVRRFGRSGAGPGEIKHLKALLRCGDSLVTLDIEGSRTSIFSLDGRYLRAFRFGSPQGSGPYSTACNRDLVFAHFGWEDQRDMKPGVYRSNVPFWISGADSVVRRVIGSYPGSERFGLVLDGQFRGARPLPLGKQPVIAIGADRVYIGTADRYEILVFGLDGTPRDTIRKRTVNLETTRADIENLKQKELATHDKSWHAGIERDFATMPFPRTIPAYASMVVDYSGNLWVQDFPRTRSPNVTWTVFDRAGRQVTEIALPADLTVFEIGRDYILGRWLNAEESIPQVRMYRLRRPGAQ